MQRIRKRSKFNRRRNSLRCRGSGREVELTGRGEAYDAKEHEEK